MKEREGGDRITVRVGGSVSGQVAAGRDIHQQYLRTGDAGPVTEADRAEIAELVAELRRAVTEAAPADDRDVAAEQVDALEDAVLADEPDLERMSAVRTWFALHLPALAGAVKELIMNPLIRKVVEAAGEVAAAQFKGLFG